MTPWRFAIASGFILGLVVGIPYYGLPYFYDYFEAAFGWSRSSIMLGLPLGTLVTLAVGPLLVRRLPPRQCIAWGAPVCGLAIAGFGLMGSSLWIYYLLWILYMTGWTFAGPLSHQVLLTHVFERKRGAAFALAFFGISLFGAFSVAALARPLTASFGFQFALRVIGAVVCLASPIALLALPATEGQARSAGEPAALGNRRVFWLLMAGTTLSMAGVGGISQHLKLIFKEAGYGGQAELDAVFGWTLMIMLIAGASGRFLFAWATERFEKRHVITVAFGLMAGAMPMLFFLGPAHVPYLFGAAFGLGMSADSLMLPLLAADYFGSKSMVRAIGIIVPVNTVGQTWFPSLVSVLWAVNGNYTLPLWVTFGCILGGRLTLALLPKP
jgi:MFS family permease